MSASTLYFAYGSNLNKRDIQEWCERAGYPVPRRRYCRTAILPDYDLGFTRRSTGRRGGVLDVVPRIGQIVHGCLFEVDQEFMSVVDAKEGHPNCYERFPVVVLNELGEEIDAISYRVRKKLRQPFVQPTQEYVDIVKCGLKSYGFPVEQLEAAAENGTPRWQVAGFFVYGTLMRRECRFEAIRKLEPKCILLAKTHGKLLDRGDFPGLTDVASSDDLVSGEFVRFDDPGNAAQVLDRIEGFLGYGSEDSLFRRTTISIDVGDGRIRPAWTYCIADRTSAAPRIPSGNWRQHRGIWSAFVTDLVRAHMGDDEQRIAERLTCELPFSMAPNRTSVIQSLLPLKSAVLRGQLSERRLAQHTDQWAVIP